ncbi:hypothetical protein [Pseudodesulfovibrio sp. zrk46]|uniref:hypothetical protein n=1 Tax=Pseudodesulfovibrio sp. zrk46 TaxID=2725288 RepID=UPI00144941B9|nr:hypothetical protein [Pseudodesulfovibrio sp. zrk46]QJB55824.1 hypothetical protein HFN16_05120 [Pseudodesulfovibrio sp. zrk46]
MSTVDFAKSVGLGAATGAASTLGGGLATTLLLGGGSAAMNEAGNQLIKKGTIKDGGKVFAASIRGTAGAIGGRFGEKIGKNIGRISAPKTIPIKPVKNASKLGAITSSSTTTEGVNMLLQRFQDGENNSW